MKIITTSNQLRDYQTALVGRINRSIAQGNRKIIAQLPTGAGKSHCIAHITQQYSDNNKRVLIVAHRIELIDQVHGKLEIKAGVIKAGVTPDYSLSVQVGSIMSMKSRLDKVGHFDLIIIDECHRSPANSYQEIIAAYPNATCIGFTATPIRTDGTGFDDFYDDLVCGESVKELIDQNFLCKYRLFADPDPMSTKGVRKQDKDYSTSALEKENDITKLSGSIVQSWYRHAKDLQTIVFAINCNHSRSIAAKFNSFGIPAIHIDGNSDSVARADGIRRFTEKQVRIMVNCDIFTEGYDCPGIECVQIARPTTSLTKYLQSIGRGMRYKGGKSVILIDHTNNYLSHGLPSSERHWTLKGIAKKKTELLTRTREGEVRFREIHEDNSVELIEIKSNNYRHVSDKMIVEAFFADGSGTAVDICKKLKIDDTRLKKVLGEYAFEKIVTDEMIIKYHVRLKYIFDVCQELKNVNPIRIRKVIGAYTLAKHRNYS